MWKGEVVTSEVYCLTIIQALVSSHSRCAAFALQKEVWLFLFSTHSEQFTLCSHHKRYWKGLNNPEAKASAEKEVFWLKHMQRREMFVSSWRRSCWLAADAWHRVLPPPALPLPQAGMYWARWRGAEKPGLLWCWMHRAQAGASSASGFCTIGSDGWPWIR